ncbi:MAG: type II toxin-antitoxin system prevent-host-death family antitoxin [Verrucomicrobiia bacterium]|jgi:prevent-host-death family protein
MDATINAKQLRALLPELVKRVRKGARFTVLYRSHPAFRIVPVDDTATALCPLEDDPLYRAKPLCRSTDGLTSADHDEVIYG